MIKILFTHTLTRAQHEPIMLAFLINAVAPYFAFHLAEDC